MSEPLPQRSERRSLEYFSEHLEELTATVRRTGHPLILTEQDKDEFVLQDAATFARMKAEVEMLATIRAIQQGIDAAKTGDVVPAPDYFRELKERLAFRD